MWNSVRTGQNNDFHSAKMAKISLLRVLLNERLTAVADEIFGAVEKTVAEYQEEIYRSKEENEKLRRLLDIVLKPDIKLHRSDLQQLTVSEKVPPEQQHCEQELSPSLGQEDPESTQINEQELRTSHGREQLHALESKDPNVIFTIACVKSLCQNPVSTEPSHIYQTQSVEYEQGPSLPSTSTEQIKTEPDGEGYMSLEPTSEPQPLSAFHHYSAVQRENRILNVASGELPSGSKPSESKRARVSQIGTAGLHWGTLWIEAPLLPQQASPWTLLFPHHLSTAQLCPVPLHGAKRGRGRNMHTPSSRALFTQNAQMYTARRYILTFPFLI
uniref:Uncharacterized protein n=1 Tax=Oncorhynchus mykiss TaxID=8022 RepID=A0A8C7QN04_ONCMY